MPATRWNDGVGSLTLYPAEHLKLIAVRLK
jgi:hypothetical protein